MILAFLKRVLILLIVLGGLWWCTGFYPPLGVSRPLIRVQTSQKIAALTFDDGPSPSATPLILKVLRRNHIHATFFVLGEHGSAYPELLTQIVSQGNELGNHSWDHPHLVLHGTAFARDQIQRTNDLIVAKSGTHPAFFRPPYGQYTLGIMSAAHQAGLTTTLWSDTAFDWLTPGAAVIAHNVLTHLKPGSIILMHDGGGDRRQTVEALSQIIREGQAQGYRFVTLSELSTQFRDTSLPR